MKSKGSNYCIPNKKGYARHVQELQRRGINLWDVEHYRVSHNMATEGKLDPPVHVAACIDMAGYVYLGIAVCNGYGEGEDQYSRARGHEIALGKALALVVKGESNCSKKVDITRYKGVQLRDYLRPTAEIAAASKVNQLINRRWMRGNRRRVATELITMVKQSDD